MPTTNHLNDRASDRCLRNDEIGRAGVVDLVGTYASFAETDAYRRRLVEAVQLEDAGRRAQALTALRHADQVFARLAHRAAVRARSASMRSRAMASLCRARATSTSRRPASARARR